MNVCMYVTYIHHIHDIHTPTYLYIHEGTDYKMAGMTLILNQGYMNV